MGSGLDKVHCREFHSTWHKTMGGLRHTEHLKGAALTVSYMWLSCANWTRCWESCRATWTASLRTSDQRKPIVQICWLTFVGAWAPYCVLCHCAKRCHIPFLVWTLTCGGHDRESTDADIAIVNAGTIRCDRMVAPGPFTVRDLLAFLPIDDAVIVFGACVDEGQSLLLLSFFSRCPCFDTVINAVLAWSVRPPTVCSHEWRSSARGARERREYVPAA